jgi:hypothetical protein
MNAGELAAGRSPIRNSMMICINTLAKRPVIVVQRRVPDKWGARKQE